MIGLKEHVERLADLDESERIYAAEDIGYLNAAEGVPALLERLAKEPSRAVRDAIFQALIRIDADAAIEGPIQLLADPDPQIRNQAAEVLRRKGAAAIPFLNVVMRDGHQHLRKLVLDILSGMQADGTDTIYADALADQNVNVIITAVENVGKMRAAQFRRRIEELLLDGNAHPMLVAACLEALAGIGDERSLPAIRSRCPDPAALPHYLLMPYLKSIGALGSDREFREVATRFGGRVAHLCSPILGALAAIYPRCQPFEADENLLAALRSAVDNQDPLCRYEAVRVLGFWGAREDVYPFLIDCLSNPERLVRLGAAEALRATERAGLGPVLAKYSLAELDEEVLEALGR